MRRTEIYERACYSNFRLSIYPTGEDRRIHTYESARDGKSYRGLVWRVFSQIAATGGKSDGWPGENGCRGPGGEVIIFFKTLAQPIAAVLPGKGVGGNRNGPLFTELARQTFRSTMKRTRGFMAAILSPAILTPR